MHPHRCRLVSQILGTINADTFFESEGVYHNFLGTRIKTEKERYLKRMAAHHLEMLKHATFTLELITRTVHLNDEVILAPHFSQILLNIPGGVLTTLYNFNQHIQPAFIKHLTELFKHCPSINFGSINLNRQVMS